MKQATLLESTAQAISLTGPASTCDNSAARSIGGQCQWLIRAARAGG